MWHSFYQGFLFPHLPCYLFIYLCVKISFFNPAQVTMVTGDQPLTAESIARNVLLFFFLQFFCSISFVIIFNLFKCLYHSINTTRWVSSQRLPFAMLLVTKCWRKFMYVSRLFPVNSKTQISEIKIVVEIVVVYHHIF